MFYFDSSLFCLYILLVRRGSSRRTYWLTLVLRLLATTAAGVITIATRSRSQRPYSISIGFLVAVVAVRAVPI